MGLRADSAALVRGARLGRPLFAVVARPGRGDFAAGGLPPLDRFGGRLFLPPEPPVAVPARRVRFTALLADAFTVPRALSRLPPWSFLALRRAAAAELFVVFLAAMDCLPCRPSARPNPEPIRGPRSLSIVRARRQIVYNMPPGAV